jgi:hypothetical protein
MAICGFYNRARTVFFLSRFLRGQNFVARREVTNVLFLALRRKPQTRGDIMMTRRRLPPETRHNLAIVQSWRLRVGPSPRVGPGLKRRDMPRNSTEMHQYAHRIGGDSDSIPSQRFGLQVIDSEPEHRDHTSSLPAGGPGRSRYESLASPGLTARAAPRPPVVPPGRDLNLKRADSVMVAATAEQRWAASLSGRARLGRPRRVADPPGARLTGHGIVTVTVTAATDTSAPTGAARPRRQRRPAFTPPAEGG